MAALRTERIDADVALSAAERVGAVIVTDGTVTFRHTLIRGAVWSRATPSERREAHAARAAVLQKAADLGTGTVRLRALVELAQVNYRLGLAQGVADSADALAAVADPADPEQEMLACYTRAACVRVRLQ